MLSPAYAATPAANYHRGVELASQGKFAEARAAFDAALADDLYNLPVKNCLGLLNDLQAQRIGRLQAYLQKVNLQAQDSRQVQFVRDKIKSLEKLP